MGSNHQLSIKIELPNKIGKAIKQFISVKNIIIWCFAFLVIGGGHVQWDEKTGKLNCEAGGIPVLFKVYNHYLNDQNKRKLQSKQFDMNPSNNPSFKCYQEMKAKLSTLKCDTEICIENKLETEHMHEINYYSNESRISFTVKENSVCCNNFKNRLNQEMNIIHDKYQDQ